MTNYTSLLHILLWLCKQQIAPLYLRVIRSHLHLFVFHFPVLPVLRNLESSSTVFVHTKQSYFSGEFMGVLIATVASVEETDL